MKTRELKRRLRRLGKLITQHIDAPNYGGCAVIAGTVGTAVRALGFQVEVITSRSGATGKEARSNLSDPLKASAYEWSDVGLSRHHLALRVRTAGGRCFTWDSNGIHDCSLRFGGYYRTYRWGLGLTPEEALAMSAKQHGWNKEFKRKQIPTIKALTQCCVTLGI